MPLNAERNDQCAMTAEQVAKLMLGELNPVRLEQGWANGVITSCMPWVAVLLESKTPSEAHDNADELLEVIQRHLPTWHGWTVNYERDGVHV